MKKGKQKQAGFAKVAECLYRNQTSGTYYALVKRNGRQIRRSLKTKDRKLAERRLKEFRQSAERLSEGKGDRRITFRELSELWSPTAIADLKPKSRGRVELSLRLLNKSFGPHLVTNMTSRDCQLWANKRGANIAASTYNQDIQTLKRVFEYAVEEGIILDNPARGLKRRRVVNKAILIPSREEFEKLTEILANGDSRYYEALVLVKLLALSGMRLAEATSITWGEIDFAKDIFLVSGGNQGTKNRLVRHVPIFPSLKEFLMELKGNENPEKDERLITIGSAKNAMSTACRLAALPHFTHHCLRHYFVSNAIEKGIDFKTIASWIGHKDGGLLVAKTYGHLRDTHSMEMAKRMT